MECFGCHDVKCAARFADEHPLTAVSYPLETFHAFQLTSAWTDWPIQGAILQQSLAAPEPTNTPATQPFPEIDLTINGVRFQMLEADVLKALGKPSKTKKGEEDACVGGFHRYQTYDGLTIDLLSDEHGRRYAVSSMELTSPKWEIAPGIHIGDSIEAVINTFGAAPFSQDGSLSYGIRDRDAWVGFDFEGGKLVRVTLSETLC
jgi:hypothetical protein